MPQDDYPMMPDDAIIYDPVEDGIAVARQVYPNIQTTSGYRGPEHPLTKKNPDTLHTLTKGAVDSAALPGMTFDQYVDGYKKAGYEILEAIDEYKNPSPHATGKHWHVVLGRRAGAGEAPAQAAPETPEDDADIPMMPDDAIIYDAQGNVLTSAKNLVPRVEMLGDAPPDIPTYQTNTMVEAPDRVGGMYRPDRMTPEHEKYFQELLRDPNIKSADIPGLLDKATGGFKLGSSVDELEEYRQHQWKNKQDMSFAYGKQEEPKVDVTQEQAGVLGFGQGPVVNFLEELGAVADTIGLTEGRKNIWNSDGSLGHLWVQNLVENEDIVNAAREEHPWTYFLSEAVGGLVGFGSGVKSVEGIGALGAGYGLTAGLGEQGDLSERIQSGGKGLVGGAIAGVVLGKALNEAGARLGKPAAAVTKEELTQADFQQAVLKIENELPINSKAMLRSGTSRTALAAERKPVDIELPTFEAPLTPKQKLQARVDELTAGWEAPPQFNIVNSTRNLPRDLQRQLTADNARGAYGFVDKDGVVHLIEKNIPNENVVPALVFHESLGHVGLRRAYQDGLDTLLTNIYRTNHNIRNEALKFLNDPSNAAFAANRANQTARAVEEVLARMNESGELDPKIWDRIVAYVRDTMRKVTGKDIRYSDAEVREILRTAQRTVTKGEGKGAATADAPAYMYVGTNARGSKRVSPETGKLEDEPRLKQAKLRESRGEDAGPSSKLRKETGWFKVKGDQGWRREIADNEATFTEDMQHFLANRQELLDQLEIARNDSGGENPTMALDEFLDHPKLFEEYPELGNITLHLENTSSNDRGWADEKGNIGINVNSAIDSEEVLNTILHEIQHQIQTKENWSSGTSLGNVFNEGKRALARYPSEDIVTIANNVEKYLTKNALQTKNEITVLNEFKNDPLAKEYFKVYQTNQKNWDAFQEAQKAFDNGKLSEEDVQEVKKIWSDSYDTLNKLNGRLKKNALNVPENTSWFNLSEKQQKWFIKVKSFLEKGFDDSFLRDSLKWDMEKIQKLRHELEYANQGKQYADVSKGDLIDLIRTSMPNEFNFQAYQYAFGEIEARDTAFRRTLTDAQRQEIVPYSSEGFDLGAASFGREGEVPRDPTMRSEDSSPSEGGPSYMMPRDEDQEPVPSNINMERINSSDDAKAFINKTAASIPRQTITDEEVGLLAGELNMTPAKLKKLNPNITPEVAVASRIALVKSAEDLVKKAKKAYGYEATASGQIAFQKALLRHKAMQEAVTNMTSNAGRVLRSFNTIVSSDAESTLRGIQKLLKSSQLDALNDPELMYKLAGDIDNLAENPEAINKAIDNLFKPYWYEWISSGRQSLMLSSWTTDVKNALDTVAGMTVDNFEHALAAGIGKLRGGKNTPFGHNQPDSVIPMMSAVARPYAMTKALMENFNPFSNNAKKLKQAWDDGHPVHSVSKYEQGQIQFKGPAGILQLPYNKLAVGDQFFRNMIENANFYDYAIREASKEGKKGAEFWDRVDELIKNPTEEIMKKSDAHTAEMQLVDEPSLLGQLLSDLKSRPARGSKRDKWPIHLARFAAQILFPFHTVSDRILMRSIRRSPLAFLDKNTREAFKAGGAQRDLALARIITGTMFLGAVWQMMEANDNVSGEESNYDRLRFDEAHGKTENSIQLGGKWYSLEGMDMLGLPLRTLGTIHDRYKRGELTEEDALSDSYNVAFSIAEQLSSNNFTDQISDFFGLFKTGPMAESNRENFVAGHAASVVPAIMRQYNYRFNDTVTRATGGTGTMADKIEGRVKASIPGLSEQLPVRYDVYGEPVMRDKGDTGAFDNKPATDDPIKKEVFRLSQEPNNFKPLISPADRRDIQERLSKVTGEEKPAIDESIIQEYQRYSGEMTYAALNEAMADPAWAEKTDEEKITDIKKIVKDMRSYAKDDMFGEVE